MKKKIAVITAVLLVAVTALFSIGIPQRLYVRVKGVKIDYNNCTEYSKDDIDSAAKVVMEKVEEMEGCVLFSLKFSNADELDYCRSLNEPANYEECIVFNSAFRSPLKSRFGAWNTNSLYTWDWYLARVKDGQWELVTWGYA